MDDFGMGYALGQDSNDGRTHDGWGGGGSWIFAFLIIALIFGGRGFGGFGGWGGGCDGAQGAVTRADLCSEFNFNGLENAVRGVQNGLCDGFYAVNTGMLNGFHGVDNAICNLGYQGAQLASGINMNMNNGFNGVTAGLNSLANQLASCCCETQRQVERGFCDVGYNMATNTCNIIQNAHNDTDRVLCKLNEMESTRQQEKIEALRLENQNLKFQASQASQNAFIATSQEAQTAELIRRCCPAPVPAYQVPAPYPYCGPGYGMGYGMGYGRDGWGRDGFRDGCGCGFRDGCGCGCC